MERGVLIGLGNPNFRDDGVGYWIVEAMKGEVKAVHLLSPTLNILKHLLWHERAVIVDSVAPEGTPGRVVEFLLKPNQRTNHYGGLTHSLSLDEVITVGYMTFPDAMPPAIKFIGVEAEDISGFGASLSEPVRRSLPTVARMVREFLNGSDVP